ncbi:hypothetical protein R4575_16770 [Acinetobacter baumannii]|nr:hypothetical protein [Acinetobacter baumannii]
MHKNNKATKALYWQELKDGNWEGKPPIVINPFRQKTALKYLMSIPILIYLLFFATTYIEDFMDIKVRPAAQIYYNDGMKPDMEKLARQGKASAILWLAQYYPKEQNSAFDQLVSAKNPDALMIKAQQLHPSNKDLSLKYLQAAAQEGHPAAIKYLSKEKLDNRMDMTDFFKTYVFKD